MWNQCGNDERLAGLDGDFCFLESEQEASEQRDFNLNLGMLVRTKSSALSVEPSVKVALGAAQMQLANLEVPRIKKRGHENSICPRDPGGLPQCAVLSF